MRTSVFLNPMQVELMWDSDPAEEVKRNHDRVYQDGVE